MRNISYDKNGNLLSLTRLGRSLDGWKIFDSLSYVYNGNRLKDVDDEMIGQTSLINFHDVGCKYARMEKQHTNTMPDQNFVLLANQTRIPAP